jgi:hypothetical protein
MQCNGSLPADGQLQFACCNAALLAPACLPPQLVPGRKSTSSLCCHIVLQMELNHFV